jgi:hypothetical protein
VISLADSDISNFEEGKNISSTQKLNLPPPGSLPSLVEQTYSLNKFETAIEFNATMNDGGKLLAQGANGPQNRAPGADELEATAGNTNSDNMQCQGMDPMVISAQKMFEIKAQREENQRHHEERMQFEADERHEEARQCKAELQDL